MEKSHKKILIKYLVIFALILVFSIIVIALSLLAQNFNKMSFEKALKTFFNGELTVSSEKFRNIKITSLSPLSDTFANSSKKSIHSLSVEAFLLKYSDGELIVFIKPVFTDAGLANAVFVSDNNDNSVTYLGLLGKENTRVTVLSSTILRTEENLKKLLEQAQ